MRNGNSPRFSDFRELEARRPSEGCVNGEEHKVEAGDVIGWSRRHRLACCTACWARWRAENADAERYEQEHGYGYGYDGGGW